MAYPSNRQVVVLTGAFLAAAALAGQLRPIPASDAEQALLDSVLAGDTSLYGRIAATLAAPFDGAARRLRALRGFSAVVGAVTVFATWALARELLPDQPELAAPAAALVALQPAVWRSGSQAGPTGLELLGAAGELVIICRIATRSTGQSPTPLDSLLVAASAVGVGLLRGQLRGLAALLALAAGYDAARDHAWLRLLIGVGSALGAGMASTVAAPNFPPPAGEPSPAGARAALATAAAGGLGSALALLLHDRAGVRSRADNGARLSTAAVRLARWLVAGWVALRLAQRDQHSALDTLAPLSIGFVAGVAAITERSSQA
jgi:hypothetical protein